jgi:hypothetical protein
MKSFKTPSQFVLDRHAIACKDWKRKIEREFPELFPKETTLKVGDRLKISDMGEYIIARSAINSIMLVSIESGNCWTKPHIVKDVYNVTYGEFCDALDRSSDWVNDNVTNLDGTPISNKFLKTILPSIVEVSEEFIRKAHSAADTEWKNKISTQYPELFGPRYIQLINSSGDVRKNTLNLGTYGVTPEPGKDVTLTIGRGMVSDEAKRDRCIVVSGKDVKDVSVVKEGEHWVIAIESK